MTAPQHNREELVERLRDEAALERRHEGPNPDLLTEAADQLQADHQLVEGLREALEAIRNDVAFEPRKQIATFIDEVLAAEGGTVMADCRDCGGDGSLTYANYVADCPRCEGSGVEPKTSGRITPTQEDHPPEARRSKRCGQECQPHHQEIRNG